MQQADHGCGIDEFVRSPNVRLRGVIKKYFEDFHVHEIQRNGDVCSLSSIRNKHDIIKEIQERRKVLSGDDMLEADSISVSPELIDNLQSLGVSQSDVNDLIIFINILGEIKKLTNSHLLNNKMFKLDNRGKLMNTLELSIKLYNSDVGKACSEDNILLKDSSSKPRSDKDSANLKKEKRKTLHNLIKKYIPFVTSQTSEHPKKIGTLIETSKLQHRNFSISGDIFDEISKLVKAEPGFFESFGRETQSRDSDERGFDTIVLKPSSDYIYSLRNVKQNVSATKDNSPENEAEIDADPRCKRQRIEGPESELNAESRTSLALGSSERWDPSTPDYIHFTIYKENRDTTDAVNTISKCLKRNHKSFGIAGLKDRRGITVQRASAYRVLESQLIYSTASKNWDRNIRISEFKYEHEQINIGDLDGNLFHVVIRDLSVPESSSQEEKGEKPTVDVIEELVGEIKSSGFINYFGLQRFGTSEIPTYKIGISLLKKEWKKAFYLILGFDDEKVSSYSTEKKELYRQVVNDDFEEYQKRLTSHSYLERLVLNGFINSKKKKVPSNAKGEANEDLFRESLNSLPKNSYSLYIHSLQSLIFNIIASERIKKYGKNPVIGDLVMLSNAGGCCDNDEDCKPTSGRNVITLENESDLANFNMQDVILTLPGDDVTYSPIMRGKYQELIEKYMGLDIQKNSMGIPGGYRKVLVIPDYVNYLALNIEERPSQDENKFPDSKVILSDLDILTTYPELKQQLGKPEPILSPKMSGFKCESKNSPVNTIVFSCKLPKSSYVTIALRELLGNSPSERS